MRDKWGIAFPLRHSFFHFLIVFACALFSFFNLTHWDGEWYRQIVEVGYSAVHSADPFAEGKGNVGFFPGYPLLCYLVKKTLGFGSDLFPTTGALLLTSNFFALLSWIYLEKWLKLWGDSNPRPKILLLALYPYCFFFCCAYSDSLFVSMILGFFYFSERFVREEDQKKAGRYFWLAILHGFFMNFTRLLGVVLIVYPVLRSIQTREKKMRAILISASGLIGPLLFFSYCKIRFDAWDFYFKTERAIWGTYIDLGRLFPPKTLFDFSKPLHANTISKYVTILCGFFLAHKLVRLLREKQMFAPVLAIFLCAGLLWGEYLLGRTSWDYVGMGRYLIPVFALTLPFLKIEPKANWKWIAIGTILGGLQVAFALKFGRHGWVA